MTAHPSSRHPSVPPTVVQQHDTPSPSVIDLITSRRDGGRDGYRLGLAVEGGGLRGIVSGSMLLALDHLDLTGVFDTYYGTSSGSMNLAYTFSGADWDGMSVYYDHLTRGFLRRRRRWDPTRSILDMDYAFDQVMGATVPIDWQRVAALDRPVYEVLTDVDRVRAELKDMRHMGAASMAYAKAGSWMPLLAGPPPVIDGTRYLDAVLLCPDPVYAAVDDGCTHVLVLASSPAGRWPAVPRSRPLVRALLNRWQGGLGDGYVAARRRWDRDRRRARFDDDQTVDAALVRRIATPPGSPMVPQLTTRRDLLLDGARAGYQAVRDVFDTGAGTVYFSLALR